MIMRNCRLDCQDARLYYYDILHQESQGEVPKATLQHVSACTHCQGEIERLELVLDKEDEPSKAISPSDARLLGLLRQHFSYADKSVTCSIARSFFPSLADDEVRIRIPTPITAHIDQCIQCSKALNALLPVGLSRWPSDQHVPGQWDESDRVARSNTASAPASAVLGQDPVKFRPTLKTKLQLLHQHIGKIAAVLLVSAGLWALTAVEPVSADHGARLFHAALEKEPYLHFSRTWREDGNAQEETWILRDDLWKIRYVRGELLFEDYSGTDRPPILPGIPAEAVTRVPSEAGSMPKGSDWEILAFGETIPEGAEYSPWQIDPDRPDKRIQVIKWSKPGNLGAMPQFVCRVYAATNSNLPHRTELNKWAPAQDTHKPYKTIEISRPSKEEVFVELEKRFALKAEH